MAEETDSEMLDRLGSDAQKWAEEFVTRFDGHQVGGATVEEGLMIAWFANAIQGSLDRQTFVQSLHHAHGRISYHDATLRRDVYGVTNGDAVEAEECFRIARRRLDDAQMWFTRGMALKLDKFNPADLEERT